MEFGIVWGNQYYYHVQHLAYHALCARPLMKISLHKREADAIRTIPLVRKEVGRHGKERVSMQTE